ncbi:putative viral A-type inclusion protein [Sulfurihydrogenibium azorense Az-Fu1]|uniref:Putative viral A-type inclusion protein n=1 Tax=Sulfurihydrogenibium azorense (strain DSM 15241 / OCM 825 / Az-Fu1) TaxID=204536 RepID=C1DT80_SULAA|nr:viral A-type inclusion protein [Sulfurihydrogenibium azorense]ACN98871.1 putative viral A-type inclusion protein [Sulfurihydrogenibium azorense Az-Fu1]
MKYFKFLIVLLIFTTQGFSEQMIVEPKVIEYKGVKEEQLKKVEDQVQRLYQKQKSLEEKLSQIENIKGLSQKDKEILQLLMSDIEEIKQNQRTLDNKLEKLYNYTNKALLLQNIIQFVIFSIFIVFMYILYILYKYKKDTNQEIKEFNEEIEKLAEKDESEIIMNLTEKAKEDPKAAAILKAYLDSRRKADEV